MPPLLLLFPIVKFVALMVPSTALVKLRWLVASSRPMLWLALRGWRVTFPPMVAVPRLIVSAARLIGLLPAFTVLLNDTLFVLRLMPPAPLVLSAPLTLVLPLPAT